MKVIGVMATYDKRAHTRVAAINSIRNQVDSLYVIDNSQQKVDRADNAKFVILDGIESHCYYFTLDDDLIYPPDYVKKTIEAIKKYGCIIAHHGRRLKGTGLNYYRGHQSFQCLNRIGEDVQIDVAGTGVTAFSTKYFHPEKLADSLDLRMSDLIFSLEAAKQGKKIGVVAHEAGWIKHIPNKETIFDTENRNGIKRQNEIADEIYRLNYESRND